MQVNAKNFSSSLAQILADLRSSVFVAIDLEFSGLYGGPRLQPSQLDCAQERYWKQQQSVKSFRLLELGLCAVKSTPDNS